MIIDTHPPKFDEPAAFAGRKDWNMSKLTKWLLISIAAVSLGWSSFSSLYSLSVADELATLRKENRNDLSYLRNRIRELDSELNSILLDMLDRPSVPVDGAPDPAPSEAETTETPEGDTETDNAPEDTMSGATEEVTIPTHQSPETEVSDKAEGETVPTLYLVAERDGIIGLFDASGDMLRQANVFVMTLPEADRKTLAVGIPASSLEEALSILEQYE